jgi:demethylmenaquinone methyltransferase/2-methoxy-6-polyprenyl-1,4-benzoquinol methylase
MDLDELLAGQVAYYDARAPEYDDWWERRGGFDLGPEFARRWRADIAELHAWLDAAGPLGETLELAAGTGNWTRELVRRASRVTAVDTSEATLALNAAKLGDGAAVDHVVADVFAWSPPRRFDTVTFAFWASHVPGELWAGFWDLVDRALAPGGVVLFCDNAHPAHAGTWGGPANRGAAIRGERIAGERVAGERMTRVLADGSRHEVVKRFWTPAEITRDLADLGWRCTAGQTSFAFLYCRVERADRPG